MEDAPSDSFALRKRENNRGFCCCLHLLYNSLCLPSNHICAIFFLSIPLIHSKLGNRCIQNTILCLVQQFVRCYDSKLIDQDHWGGEGTRRLGLHSMVLQEPDSAMCSGGPLWYQRSNRVSCMQGKHTNPCTIFPGTRPGS